MPSQLFDVYDVFTPTTQATLNFVERPHITNLLVDALRTPGKQLIVFGESGSGKSTLIQKKLSEVYEGQVITQCTRDMTFEQMLLDAFDQLAPFYEDARSSSKTSTKQAGISQDYFVIKGKLDASSTETKESSSKRILPPQLTPQRLGQFLGARQICWVIEDFHKVKPDCKTSFAQTLKIFCDLAGTYRFVKVVAIGATATAREVIEYDHEMSNRVAEIEVPLMNPNEIEQILIGGENLMNISFGDARDVIVHYSVGVASIAHQLALNMCVADERFTSASEQHDFGVGDLQRSLKKYISECSDTLKAHFDLALQRHRVVRYDNGRLILTALSKGPVEGMTYNELMNEIREDEASYPNGNLTTYVSKLQGDTHGNVIRLEPDGRYRFTDPFHHLYAHLTLTALKTSQKLSSVAIADEMRKELDRIFVTFVESSGELKLHFGSPEADD